jgi:hypothetical protein
VILSTGQPLLISCSKVLLEKISRSAVKKFPAFYGTPVFIALSYMNLISTLLLKESATHALKMRPDCSCSVSCVSVCVDGFTSPSPSNAFNHSRGLEGFATVSVRVSVHTATVTRVSAARAVWTPSLPLKSEQKFCMQLYTAIRYTIDRSHPP